MPVPLAALAVAEFVAARRVRAAVRHDPDAKPMAAIVIARCVALGKASSLVGAGGGRRGGRACWCGCCPTSTTVRVAATRRPGRRRCCSVASVLLVVAGLLLERAGIDPNNDRRDARPVRVTVRFAALKAAWRHQLT